VIERARTAVALRALQREDREPVHDILVRTGFFTAVEVSTALELIDDWLTNGEPSGYLCFVATDPGTDAVLGYVCVGPAPLTDGTYDLYWIAVDPHAQSRGIGRALLDWAETEVVRCGYALVARIAEYYRQGDDKLVFGKYLSAGRGPGVAETGR
jgi:ribosomal protein S18 acetylase RimI-like enzyme